MHLAEFFNNDKKEVPLKGRKPCAVCAENNNPGNGNEAEGKKIGREVVEMNDELYSHRVRELAAGYLYVYLNF